MRFAVAPLQLPPKSPPPCFLSRVEAFRQEGGIPSPSPNKLGIPLALLGHFSGLGYRNIEVHATSASDLSFIKDDSVDFVLANGLLCNMADHRPLAVNEIKRILKPTGQAYLSLEAIAPIGFVDRVEWERILDGFTVKQRGGFIQKWAAVSKKNNGKHISENYVETPKRPRFLTLRKKLGE